MKTQKKIIFFLIAFFFHLNLWAQRIGNTSENWKIIKTEHFDVVFSAEQQDLGLYYAQVAEKAYQNLAHIFTNRPERTRLVVNDTTDISNGYATRIPYPIIMAFSVQIGDHETLSEAGEWARELLVHEMTHILQFEPALGIYKYIRPIFGNIVAPNLLLPLWWKEGMAVEMETQLSPQGRSRSKFQDATLRAFVLDKKLFEYTLDQANEVLPSWPYGSRSYLQGSIFWSHLLAETNVSSVNHIVSRQGSRFPYTFEEPLRELVDHTYETEYTKALYDIEKNSQAQIEKIKTEKTSDFNYLPHTGQNSLYPRFSKAFRYLAYLEHQDADTRLIILDADLKQLSLKNLPEGSINSFDFHPTEKKLIYSKVDKINSKYKWADLYIYDLEKEDSKQITFSQRARDVSFSEDGQSAVFIATFNGKTQVKVINLADAKITSLAESHFSNRYQSPVFWNQNEILVTKRNTDGAQQLYKINISSGIESKVSLDLKQIRFLRKINKTLYFASAENGVFNIYETSDLKKATAVTNTLTGIWSYDINPADNRLWATSMTSHGFHVGSAELGKYKKPLPVVTNKIESRYKFKETEEKTNNYTPEEYTPSSYLLPQYWIPFISSSSNSKGAFIQASTTGQDPVQIHQYALSANYDTELQKGGFLGLYTNSTMTVPFQLGSQIKSQAFGDIDNLVETKTTYFDLMPDLFFIDSKLLFQIGVQHQETDYFGSKTFHWAPFLQLAYLDYSQNIFQISPEDGWGGYLRYENNQNIKDSVNYNKAIGGIVGYLGLPKHHVLMSRLNASLTFETVSSRFGASSSSMFYASDVLIPQFILRGYQPYQFYGRSIWNINTEYRFPLIAVEKGFGTDPYFFKRLSGAVVVDGLGVEGGSITEDRQFRARNLNESFWSSGLEIKLETTIGYILPVNFVLGFYVPHSPQYSSSTQTGLSLQIGGF